MTSMTTPRTLIVGAGITGATVARLLHDAKRSLQYAGDVIVWEKNNIAGGRMMARSFKKNRHVHVDMGAQYLTNFSSANDDIRALLMREGKLTRFSEAQVAQDLTRPPPTNVDHTVANDALGFRAVVEHFLVDSETQTSREVERIEVVDNGTRVKVVATDGHEEIVDDLVLTCPIPNLLSILENSAFKTQESQLEALQAVEYSQRIAVALLFDTSIAEEVGRLGWTSKYVAKDEDDIVRYLCWDNLKKQQGTDSFALLVHTGVPFGVQRMDDKDKNDEILATILASVKKLLPFLPEPEDSLLHRWRMSQVTKPYRQAGAGESTPSITLSQSPRIIVAGDAFLGSVFDNCLLSAKHAAAAILESRGPTSGL